MPTKFIEHTLFCIKQTRTVKITSSIATILPKWQHEQLRFIHEVSQKRAAFTQQYILHKGIKKFGDKEKSCF
jgi:hypothetical protein